MHVDTRWFQDFLTLSEVLNFTRASEIRNLSQAAFSRRISSLEQTLGARLIERNAYPTRLTPAGEKFRDVAAQIIGQLADVKAELGGGQVRDQVKIAMPYALATTRLPAWWEQWNRGQCVICSLEVGNVHDTVSSFVAGNVDLLICFYQNSAPIQIDPEQFDRAELGREAVRPYASPALIERLGGAAAPGSPSSPAPLLMYSASVYFARVVNHLLERAPLKLDGVRVFESEMSDVLGDLAAQGHGIAWLPDSSFKLQRHWDLKPVGNGHWDGEVSILAFKPKNNLRPPVMKIWREILGQQQVGMAVTA